MGNSISNEKEATALKNTIDLLLTNIKSIPNYQYQTYQYIEDTIYHFDPLYNITPEFAPMALKLNGIRLYLPGAQEYIWAKYHTAIQKRITQNLPKLEKIAHDTNDKYLTNCLYKFRETCDQTNLVDWSLSQDT
jgi:hypothetical protein